MTTILKRLSNLPKAVKIIAALALLVSAWFIYQKFGVKNTPVTTYETETVEKGTIIVTVSGSGTVSTANSANVNTKASGVVKTIYVKDGDEVKAGDKIADIDLDLQGQQTAASSLASYQSAKNNVESARIAFYTTQSDMLANWKDHYELATSSTYQNSDGSPNGDTRGLADFHISNDNWLASEAKYKNQQNVLAQAQTSLNSAWLSYQETSGTIYAPISGNISGLSLQIGSVISGGSSSSSSTSVSSTKVASVKTDAPPTVSISLTEIDVPKVKVGNKATITFDALTDKTFTGKLVSVDTSGSVSSGVTTYPATILLDEKSESILPNMAASATIITNIKNNVISITTSALEKQDDGTYSVKIMKNKSPESVPVEVGISSDTKTEVISGLSENDVVVTATNTLGTTTQNTNKTSVFGSFGGGGGSGIRMR